MDSIGSRRPVFTMKGFDKNLVWTLFAISTVSPNGIPVNCEFFDNRLGRVRVTFTNVVGDTACTGS